MKTEFKISTLSIVCALSMMAFGAASAAAPVRALGGAGTYSSASNAATAKATTAKTATATTAKTGAASTRAGVMRVLPTASTANKTATTTTVTSGSSTTGTRVSASPRLSIGKYLPNRVVNKPTVDTASKDDMTELTGRVQTLEDSVFGADGLENQLTALADRVAAGETDLADDLANVESTFTAVKDNITTIEKDIAGLTGDFGSEKEAMALVVEQIKASITELESTSGTDFTKVREEIAKLQSDLIARIAALETGKQDVLVSTTYITVNQETDAVELNLDALTSEINSKINAGAIAGVTIDFDTTTNTLEWTVPGTQTEYVRLDDIFATDAQLTAADTAIKGMISGIEARVVALESGVKALQDTVGSGEMMVDDTVVSTIIDAVNKLDEKTDKIAGDSGNVADAIAGRVTTLETDVNNQTTGLAATYTIASTNKATIEDTETGLAKAHGLVNELEDYVLDGDAAEGVLGLAEVSRVATAAIPNSSETTTDGKYVLTADVVGDVTTYKWEKIARGLFD